MEIFKAAGLTSIADLYAKNKQERLENAPPPTGKDLSEHFLYSIPEVLEEVLSEFFVWKKGVNPVLLKHAP